MAKKLTDAEKVELTGLLAACLDEDGQVKVSADAAKIKRMEQLRAKQKEAGEKTASKGTPLSTVEQTELERLETMCLNTEPYPAPDEMTVLAKLRLRPGKTLKTIRCNHCKLSFVVSCKVYQGMPCPLCKKLVTLPAQNKGL